MHIQSKAQAATIKAQINYCAFTSSNEYDIVNFDTDSISIILDTGASYTFTYCIQNFIEFSPLDDKVESLGTLKIKGVGTVKYDILDDDGIRRQLIIRNAYFVPDLSTRLISPQQVVCKQSDT